jgi:hypothetical protein
MQHYPLKLYQFYFKLLIRYRLYPFLCVYVVEVQGVLKRFNFLKQIKFFNIDKFCKVKTVLKFFNVFTTMRSICNQKLELLHVKAQEVRSFLLFTEV